MKGVPNKTTQAVKDMITAALEKAGGVNYLVKQAKENPGPFLTLVGKVIPLQVNQTHRYDLSQLSDQELADLERIADRLGAVPPGEGGEGTTRH